ncbi:glycosyltransferase family 2 protein [Ramlibacter humi]|uniref:Glycosyltransferase n=1 Tax=Ramlibacter humi TaxID=2530451 RepID=A0A4Z0BYQ9_9BURK|nr:glycosyltransferase family 2 protein [Ramlibacter humi]TFZ03822.1 glycosyltransferase [Ramlibacter humi]
MKLSVVSTLYRSAPYIRDFCARVSAQARAFAGDDYEIILVNDGSPDDSLQLAISEHLADPHVVIVDLSRNFGHHKAMMTGLAHAEGEYVFLIDSDLEELPEWLESFARRMHEEKCDVVYGVQVERKGGRFEQVTGTWFYGLFRLVTGVALPRNVVTARLMSRRYMKSLVLHDEREFFIAGLWHLTGFDQRAEPVEKLSHSETTYTLGHKVSLLVNSITSFSSAPLVGIFYVGVTILVFALAYIAYAVYVRLTAATPVSGYTSLIASVWLLGGLMVSFMGVIGIYLSKVFVEAKRRPYSIVRDVFRRSA